MSNDELLKLGTVEGFLGGAMLAHQWLEKAKQEQNQGLIDMYQRILSKAIDNYKKKKEME